MIGDAADVGVRDRALEGGVRVGDAASDGWGGTTGAVVQPAVVCSGGGSSAAFANEGPIARRAAAGLRLQGRGPPSVLPPSPKYYLLLLLEVAAGALQLYSCS